MAFVPLVQGAALLVLGLARIDAARASSVLFFGIFAIRLTGEVKRQKSRRN